MATLGTFSPSGWVTNPLEIVDFMLAYFFLTQKSQTHFHPAYVTSYQSLIADNGPDNDLSGAIETTFGDYLLTQFTNVQLNVRVAGKDNDENNNEQTITIACSFTASGKTYSLSNAIDLLGTQVNRIYRLEEPGSPK